MISVVHLRLCLVPVAFPFLFACVKDFLIHYCDTSPHWTQDISFLMIDVFVGLR